MMTNEELRQAIADANHLVRQTSKDARNYADLLAHLNGLLAEQRRRAALPTHSSAGAGLCWRNPAPNAEQPLSPTTSHTVEVRS
jgi:hypothetical protein